VANASGQILVVEDNPALLGVIALSLRNVGLEVVTAETGSEAWQMLEQHAIDLVVTDFNMPGMSGGDLCVKMREHSRHAQTPIVFLTGLSEDFQREHDLGAMNIACVIRKPFSPREVTNRVQEILRQIPQQSREAAIAGTDVPPSRMSD
jgi:DNA-binding response OmpR family regulator